MGGRPRSASARPLGYIARVLRPDAATLRFAAFPRSTAVDVALVLGGALLVAIAAQLRIPLPFTPVPITGQTFAVLLVGASLGTVRGGVSLLLYVLLGAVGAPFYAGGAHGFEVIVGATGGYLLSYPLAAAVTGALAERRWDRRMRSSVPAMLVGSAVIYLVGVPWLATFEGVGAGKAVALGMLPFVPGDLVKLVLAAAVLPGAWRAIERARRPRP